MDNGTSDNITDHNPDDPNLHDMTFKSEMKFLFRFLLWSELLSFFLAFVGTISAEIGIRLSLDTTSNLVPQLWILLLTVIYTAIGSLKIRWIKLSAVAILFYPLNTLLLLFLHGLFFPSTDADDLGLGIMIVMVHYINFITATISLLLLAPLVNFIRKLIQDSKEKA